MKSENRVTINNSIATRLLKIVFSFYIVIAIGVTLGHMIMEYRHQKENIRLGLEGIQRTFEQGIALDLWHLNQEALISTIDGMLEVPEIVGVKIWNKNDKVIAIGGIIPQGSIAGNVGEHVNLLGLNNEELAIHKDEIYKLDVFMHEFPILFNYKQQEKRLGQVTIYSNTSVIFQRVKFGFLMLIFNAVLKTAALWLIFLWFSTKLLRKPLGILTNATADISLDNLEVFSVDTKTVGQNEIKVLEETMISMVAELHKAVMAHEKDERELGQTNIQLSNINTRLRKIVETTHGLSAVAGINHFSSQLLDEFARHMVATGGSLYFVKETGLQRMHSLDPDHAPAFLEFPLSDRSILNQVIKSGKPFLVEDVNTLDTVDPSGWGGYKDGSLLAFPIPDSSGKIAGILTLHSKEEPPFIEQDKEIGAILASYCGETMRAVQAFEALQKSELQYRTLFEKTNDAIFIVEKSTGQYLDANEAAAELTGRSLEELKKLTTHDVTPRGAEERILMICNSDNAKKLGRVIYQRPDQTQRIANLTTVPLNDNSVIGIARDITHDLEIEEQLRQSQKMEAVGTLAGGIAHDFNNILSGIFGYAQVAQMDLSDSDKANESIVQIVKGAQRATDLVQQILTFSRQTEREKVPLKIYIVVKEALKFLRSSIPASINIVENIISKSMIMADATQTHQIVINLCTNAYHSMNESGGTLTVGLTETEIRQSHYGIGKKILSGKYVKLEVSDTGHGMDKITIKKIFDPYYTTKEAGKGTGLGLAVVDGIIKGHDGFIKVDSEIGRGSTFQVFWPIIEEKDLNDISDKIKTYSSIGTEQIMLVDDEKDILVPTKAILEEHGYKVTVFQDGLSAFEAFTENPDLFDLVITDITMPKMTGSALSGNILKIRSDLPIILCTGYNEQFPEDKAIEIGISKYIQKPIPAHTLLRLTREVLDRH